MDATTVRPMLLSALIALGLAIVAFAQSSIVFEYERAAQVASPEGAHAGFPLDDAWIHLVYARSIAHEGAPAYNPGEPEAGQSSLLWGVLLAPVQRAAEAFDVPIAHAVRGFSALVWIGLALAAAALLSRLGLPGAGFGALGAATLVGFDPLLAFSAASGMEPPLAALCLVLCADALAAGKTVRAGFCSGLAVLARPETLPLAALAAVCAWVGARQRERAAIAAVAASPADVATPADAAVSTELAEPATPASDAIAKSPLHAALEVLLPTALLALVWCVLCLGLTGRPLPNTWYVKAETIGMVYGAGHGLAGLGMLWGKSPWFHTPVTWILPAIGALTLVFRAQRAPMLFLLAGPVLFAAAIGATRALPSMDAYYWQRYLVPALPLLHVWTAAGIGIAGSLVLDVARSQPTGPTTLPRPVVAILVVLLVGVAFVRVGPALEASRDRFARDVRDVDLVDVGSAKWLAAQYGDAPAATGPTTPPRKSIGAMDAGAARYFLPRDCRVVDLLGLNDSELVRHAIAEEDLGPYLSSRKLDALLLLEPDPGSSPFIPFAQRLGMDRAHQALAPEYGVLGQVAPKAVTVWQRP